MSVEPAITITTSTSILQQEKQKCGQKCPYCIDAYANQCLSLGVSREEMMQAVHVGATIVLAHSTQMRKIIKKKEMQVTPSPSTAYIWPGR